MKTIDFSYFIERYNAGEMDEAEKEWFRKELQKNEMLRKEVELRSRTDAVLKNHDLMKLRSKLNAIEKQRREPVPLKKPGRTLDRVCSRNCRSGNNRKHCPALIAKNGQ